MRCVHNFISLHPYKAHIQYSLMDFFEFFLFYKLFKQNHHNNDDFDNSSNCSELADAYKWYWLFGDDD